MIRENPATPKLTPSLTKTTKVFSWKSDTIKSLANHIPLKCGTKDCLTKPTSMGKKISRKAHLLYF